MVYKMISSLIGVLILVHVLEAQVQKATVTNMCTYDPNLDTMYMDVKVTPSATVFPIKLTSLDSNNLQTTNANCINSSPDPITGVIDFGMQVTGGADFTGCNLRQVSLTEWCWVFITQAEESVFTYVDSAYRACCDETDSLATFVQTVAVTVAELDPEPVTAVGGQVIFTLGPNDINFINPITGPLNVEDMVRLKIELIVSNWQAGSVTGLRVTNCYAGYPPSNLEQSLMLDSSGCIARQNEYAFVLDSTFDINEFHPLWDDNTADGTLRFVALSPPFPMAKYTNSDQVVFQCDIAFCYEYNSGFVNRDPACFEDMCLARKKRATQTANTTTVSTVVLVQTGGEYSSLGSGSGSGSGSSTGFVSTDSECFQSWVFVVVVVILVLLLVLAVLVSFFLLFKLNKKKDQVNQKIGFTNPAMSA